MGVHRRLHRIFAGFFLLTGLSGMSQTPAWSEAKTTGQPQTVSAVMLSDLHFDPFHDPAKVPLLVKAPVEEWERILKSANSPAQESDFLTVQNACGGKGSMDSPFALMNSSLLAARAQAPDAQFVTVSGDLLVHDLDCRYRAAMKLTQASGDDQSISAAFAEKTTVFVMKQVESAFKGIPVYLALGNNDSRCNHNRMDIRDEYLRATAQAAVDGLVGVSQEEKKLALTTYESAGYYSVTMAAPMVRTRLLVLDDTYMMSKFSTCEANDRDRTGAQIQTDWITKELNEARKRGEQVWVLGHLPPTVDPINTLSKGLLLCAGKNASMYLSSDDLAMQLTSHADVVRLAIFGHTHMDELHLLGNKDAGVPVKVVASVTPIAGNTPSFTVGKVAPATATLIDYAVYEASNATGIGTTWTKEYDFDETYHESSFTAKALSELIGRFRADPADTNAEIQAYQRHYFKGLTATLPAVLWSEYVCSMDHPTSDGFRQCVCAGR